jgi:hypothetical protein
MSIIVELVLIPRSPGRPGDENKFNNNTDVKGDRGMRTSSTIILM